MKYLSFKEEDPVFDLGHRSENNEQHMQNKQKGPQLIESKI